MKSFLNSTPEAYLAFGAVSGFVMAMLRQMKYTRKSLLMRCVEAFMCSMLSSAFTFIIVLFFKDSWMWAVPVGVLVGYMGTDFVHMTIARKLDKMGLNSNDSNENP